jgi:hypothetical protein
MFETRMVLAAALMLVGAFVATGAWLIRPRGMRYLLATAGGLIFAGGVVALATTLD